MTKPNRRRLITVTRTLGALTLLVVGGVHYQQYRYDFYSMIPTIGPLFLLNAVAATVLGLFLLSPVRAPGRVGAFLDQGAAVAVLTLFLLAARRQARLPDSRPVGHRDKPSLPGTVTPSPEN